MKEVFDALIKLVTDGNITGNILNIIIITIVVVGLLWGVTKVISLMFKNMSVFTDRVTRSDLNLLKAELIKEHDNTADLVKDINKKIDKITLSTNNLQITYNEKLSVTMTRLFDVMDELKDKRSEDMMMTIIPLQKDLESLIKELNKSDQHDLTREVLKLQADLSALHGTIIGMGSQRNRLR